MRNKILFTLGSTAHGAIEKGGIEELERNEEVRNQLCSISADKLIKKMRGNPCFRLFCQFLVGRLKGGGNARDKPGVALPTGSKAAAIVMFPATGIDFVDVTQRSNRGVTLFFGYCPSIAPARAAIVAANSQRGAIP